MMDQPIANAYEKARLIELRTRRAVEEQLSGGLRSVFRGRGMDFDEVRPYVPGDDVRAIDWNVTARAGHPYIKKFREERELTLMLLVDVSGSGGFGSFQQSKRELAAELACVLALSALRSHDRIGLMLFSEGVEKLVSPDRGRGHVLRMVHDILSFRPEARGTDIPGALDCLPRTLKRRSAVMLLSDFHAPLEPEGSLACSLRATAARHDLAAIWVHDPHELALPDVGLVTLRDAETGESVLVDTTRHSVREAFRKTAEQRKSELHRLVLGAGGQLVELSTAVDYLPAMIRFFSGDARARRSA